MSDQPTSDLPAGEGEAPTTPAEAPTLATPAEPVAASEAAAPRERLQFGTGRVAAIAVIVLLIGAGAGFFLGRSTADTGPTSLSAAAQDTAKGDLPVGDLSLDQILGVIGQRQGNGGGGTTDLGGLLGGLLDGKGTDAKGLLQQFLDELQQSFDNPGAGSTAPSTPTTPPATTPPTTSAT